MPTTGSSATWRTASTSELPLGPFRVGYTLASAMRALSSHLAACSYPFQSHDAIKKARGVHVNQHFSALCLEASARCLYAASLQGTSCKVTRVCVTHCRKTAGLIHLQRVAMEQADSPHKKAELAQVLVEQVIRINLALAFQRDLVSVRHT
jgi:hypothetical protein